MLRYSMERPPAPAKLPPAPGWSNEGPAWRERRMLAHSPAQLTVYTDVGEWEFRVLCVWDVWHGSVRGPRSSRWSHEVFESKAEAQWWVTCLAAGVKRMFEAEEELCA